MKVIIDLEHTLSNANHRLHLLKVCKYDAFNNEFVRDPINKDVHYFMKSLRKEGHQIIILSAKRIKYSEKVRTWLHGHAVEFDQLIMRADNDKRGIVDFKVGYVLEFKDDILMALDDVGEICKAFCDIGVPCLRIAQR